MHSDTTLTARMITPLLYVSGATIGAIVMIWALSPDRLEPALALMIGALCGFAPVRDMRKEGWSVKALGWIALYWWWVPLVAL